MKHGLIGSMAIGIVLFTSSWISQATGQTTTYRPTTSSGDYTFPAKAYDGNLTTAASAQAPTAGGSSSTFSWWFGFPQGGMSPSSVTLKIKSSALVNGQQSQSAVASVLYSLNNGTTWVTVYSIQPPPTGGTVTRGPATDSITLPLSQDLTKVKIEAFLNVGALPVHGSAQQSIFEVWIEEN